MKYRGINISYTRKRLIIGSSTCLMAKTALFSACHGPALTPILELIYGRQARLSDRQLTPRRATQCRQVQFGAKP